MCKNEKLDLVFEEKQKDSWNDLPRVFSYLTVLAVIA